MKKASMEDTAPVLDESAFAAEADDTEFDLSDLLSSDDTTTADIPNPKTGGAWTYQGKPVQVVIHSPDSERMLNFERSITKRRLQQAKSRAVDDKDALQRMIEAEQTERVIHAVDRFINLFNNGSEVGSDRDMIRAILKHPKGGHIRDFVWHKYQSRGDFIRAASPTT